MIILGQDEEDYLKIIVWSRLILRGWIHLSSHYRGMLHDFPSSPRPFRLLLLLSREVPHIRPRGLLRARHLFLISKIHGHHWPRPTRYLDRHQSSLIRNETLRHLRGPIHWRHPPRQSSVQQRLPRQIVSQLPYRPHQRVTQNLETHHFPP